MLGIDKKNNESVIVKVINKFKLKNLKWSVKAMNELKGGPNIIELIDVVRSPLHNDEVLLIMEWVDTNNTDTITLFSNLTDEDIRFYMF